MPIVLHRHDNQRLHLIKYAGALRFKDLAALADEFRRRAGFADAVHLVDEDARWIDLDEARRDLLAAHNRSWMKGIKRSRPMRSLWICRNPSMTAQVADWVKTMSRSAPKDDLDVRIVGRLEDGCPPFTREELEPVRLRDGFTQIWQSGDDRR